jgi:hypothetical protein
VESVAIVRYLAEEVRRGPADLGRAQLDSIPVHRDRKLERPLGAHHASHVAVSEAKRLPADVVLAREDCRKWRPCWTSTCRAGGWKWNTVTVADFVLAYTWTGPTRGD